MIIIVPEAPPARKPMITKTGRVFNWASTHRPNSTPIRVVTRSESPISEKRAAYAAPRPGSIMADLTRPAEYSRGSGRARPSDRVSNVALSRLSRPVEIAHGVRIRRDIVAARCERPGYGRGVRGDGRGVAGTAAGAPRDGCADTRS